MKIKKIKVEKLFGSRDFELTLSNGHGFFFGENGAGKTTFLNVVYAMLSGQHNLIPEGLKYDKFVIEFENDFKLESVQSFSWPKQADAPTHQQYQANLNAFNNHLLQYKNYLDSIKINYPTLDNTNLEDIIRIIENKEDVNIFIQNNPIHKKIISINNIISRDLGNSNPSSWFNNSIHNFNAMTNILKQNLLINTREILDNINHDILFLNVYRNRPKLKNVNEQNQYVEGDIVFTSTKLDELKQKVQNSAQEIKKLINSYYVSMSDSLLEKILSSNDNSENLVIEDEEKEIVEKVFEYIHGIDSSKKERLKQILFGESMESQAINNILVESFKPFINEYKANALPIENNISNFLEIVNKYLVHKRISFDKKEFQFMLEIGTNKNPLDEMLLSSGEKHIFSVFSNLVFNKKENIHLLIDEPELSLSINWQKNFIKDIASFEKVKNLIFVTHSPYVIPEEMVDDLQRFPSGN
jgi:hypothetical protein